MSKEYNAYLDGHIGAVMTGWNFIKQKIGHSAVEIVLPKVGKSNEIEKKLKKHDESKYSEAEYKAYDDYFYGPDGVKSETGEPSEKVETAFNYAWLHHIHLNPHHWQHWILVEDDPEDALGGVKILEMPDYCILEMVLDWWTFSWLSGDLYAIFHWYEAHRGHICLTENSREKVEKLLNLIRLALDMETE